MAKSVAPNRDMKQQQQRRGTASDNELEIPQRRRRLTSDSDGSVVNRSGYYTASDAEPETSTIGLPFLHFLKETPMSPEPTQYEAVYPVAGEILADSNAVSGNHTSDIEKDSDHTFSSAMRGLSIISGGLLPHTVAR